MPILAVFIVDGLHVPVIVGEFVEVKGKAGAVLPKQRGPMLAKVGTIEVVISMSIVATCAH